MTVLRASNAPVSINLGKPISTTSTAQSTAWARPSDWLTFTTPTTNEQKIIGNVAIYNQESNYIALSCTTSSGTYTVDWGDGTSANFTSGTTAEKNYTWSSISSSTLTSRGYRQAVITVTPTTGGETFSTINLNRQHSSITSAGTNITNPWLDIALAAPNATTIAFAANTDGTFVSSMGLCEQINIVSQNTSSMARLFSGFKVLQSVLIGNSSSVSNMLEMFLDCYSLQTVPLFNTDSVTTMQSMFQGCYSLQTVPLFNTASVTNMQNMFQSCYSLNAVPLFNTVSVTNMQAMFNGCTLLKTVPLLNTTSVTNMQSMFNSCWSLKTVPLFNTASVTNMQNMFQACYSLNAVPLFNTASVTNMQGMFNGCSVTTVPLFNTASVTNMQSMFQSAPLLRSVPLFNTASVTNMLNMFANCNSLTEVPLFNTASVTNMQAMFYACTSLKTVPLLNTASVTTMREMFRFGNSLQTVPLFDTSSVINMDSMFRSCFSLQSIPELNLSKITTSTNNNLFLGSSTLTSALVNLSQAKLTGNRWSQDFTNCRLGATQLNEMYTSLAKLNPNVTNVTGNGTVVTYTVDDIRAFVAGRSVTMTGINPTAYNLTTVGVVTVTATTGTAGTFTVNNAATGTFVSGGIAAIQSDRIINVTSNPGTTGDDPTIATSKGWTVSGS